jgi:hypothetical protein
MNNEELTDSRNTISKEFPFSEEINEEVLGTGWESITKRIGDWVVKEPNPVNLKGQERSQRMMDFLRSLKRIKRVSADQEKLAQIINKENFAKTHYVYGKYKKNEKPNYIAVQRYIPGTALTELIGTQYQNSQEMVANNREEFKELLWGVKKAFVEIGAPIDFHPGNIIRHENTKNLVIIDAGIPTEEYEIIKSEEDNKRTPNIFENIYERLQRIGRYEKYLNLSQQEEEKLNSKYNITTEQFDEKVREIDTLRIKKGIEIDTKRDRLDKTLDQMFGEKEEMTGQEILDYAIKVLGDKKPTKSQEIFLEKLKEKITTSGDKAYWKEFTVAHT